MFKWLNLQISNLQIANGNGYRLKLKSRGFESTIGIGSQLKWCHIFLDSSDDWRNMWDMWNHSVNAISFQRLFGSNTLNHTKVSSVNLIICLL